MECDTRISVSINYNYSEVYSEIEIQGNQRSIENALEIRLTMLNMNKYFGIIGKQEESKQKKESYLFHLILDKILKSQIV